ncbi:MAG: hypothetical protein GY855_16380, partial [candidate division Zixibacteria bacterium]|nr:hypothetical protein [candidate division Zixibacteria bacterium]
KSQRLNIGGRIGISMEGYEANDNRLELCSTDRSPADADLLDQTYTKDDQTTLEKYKGSIFMGGLTFEYQTTPDIFSIFEITAYTGKLDNDGGEYTRYIDETAYLTLGDDTTFTTVDADVMGNNNYDSERKGLEVYHRNTVSLANDVTFAFGLSFRGTSYETTNLISADSTSNEVYDDGDNQPDDPDDYTRTVTSDYSTSKKETSATTTLSVPVGLEFYPVRKLAFRLGALFRCVERETETNTIILSSSAQHERIVYGDGTVSEALLQDPYDPGTNTHSLTKNIYTDTHYYYGAGWDVTENLQLDFMGFADMTDLVNWKLSAIFKFF